MFLGIHLKASAENFPGGGGEKGKKTKNKKKKGGRGQWPPYCRRPWMQQDFDFAHIYSSIFPNFASIWPNSNQICPNLIKF